MNVNIISKIDNKVLERKEIEAEISFDGATPSRNDLKDAISKKVAADVDLTVLREVHSTFGKKTVKVLAHVYSNKETMVGTEPAHLLKRSKVEEEAKVEEKPKEKPKAEEKPKEEAKVEEKPKEKPKAEEKPSEK
ncbi:hypothetical protein KKB44_01130 [Candidatus Micrarchaeota archaeon]|nr:hypothetical protein [Candidatus Micrarchaeota archaeon]